MNDKPFTQVGVSKFTHIGRHASTFQTISRMFTGDIELLLDLGSGVVEPVVLSEILQSTGHNSGAQIIAIDSDKDFIAAILELKNGRYYSTEALSEIAVDLDLNDSPVINTNFTSRLQRGLDECEICGITLSRIFDETTQSLRMPSESRSMISAFDEDLSSVSLQSIIPHKATVAYAGALAVNMAKVFGRAAISKLFGDIYDSLSDSGLLVLGTNPSHLHGKPFELSIASSIGFTVACIQTETVFVEENGQLAADTAVFCFSHDTHRWMQCYKEKIIYEQIETYESTMMLGFTKKRFSFMELICHFEHDDGLLCMCACLRSDMYYDVWLIESSRLAQACKGMGRVQFNFFRL